MSAEVFSLLTQHRHRISPNLENALEISHFRRAQPGFNESHCIRSIPPNWGDMISLA